MRNVYLYGHLRKQFGHKFRLNVDTPGQAIRLLNVNFAGFQQALRKGSYHLITGKQPKGGTHLGLDTLEMGLGRDDFHLIPVAAGAKSGGGAIKGVLGVALVGAAIFFSGGTLAAPLASLGGAIPGLGGTISFGNLAGLGAIMAVAGVAQMVSPQTKSETGTRKEDSFALSGPQNLDQQGYPVPLVIGEVIAGGIPVSTDYDVEDIAMGVA